MKKKMEEEEEEGMKKTRSKLEEEIDNEWYKKYVEVFAFMLRPDL
jgi:hypothetical protein